MSALMTASPQFDPKKPDQVAALPLGGRVKVDPWDNQLELIKTKPLAITNAAEKMPFEVTPFFPFLTRLGSAVPEKTALTPEKTVDTLGSTAPGKLTAPKVPPLKRNP
jgi:hypothetical protein